MERSARIAALEASASGISWVFAPMVDVTRDPRWGRVVESSGEDPFLGSQMAAARLRGFQGERLGSPTSVLACAKHFVAYRACESGLDCHTAEISRRTLEEVCLPPVRSSRSGGRRLSDECVSRHRRGSLNSRRGARAEMTEGADGILWTGGE